MAMVLQGDFTGMRAIKVVEIEISEPFCPMENIRTEEGYRYSEALIVARIHGFPIGEFYTELPERGLTAAEVAAVVWAECHNKINEHLKRDVLPGLDALSATGLENDTTPLCIQERLRALQSNQLPQVSVVIPTRDRPEPLERCLNSLLPRLIMFPVDDFRVTDGVQKLVSQYGHKVRYVREDRPGTAYARNTGVEEALGEIVVGIDDDVIVDKYWLLELVRGFDVAEHVACVNSLVLPAELETEEQIWFEEFGGFGRGMDLQVYDLEENHPDTVFFPYSMGIAGTGASRAITKSAWLEIGGADPALGPGSYTRNGEDLDVFFRLIKHGYKIVYQPASIAYHRHRRQYSRLLKQIHNYGIGFSAYITKNLLADPKDIPGFLLRMPYGMLLMVLPGSKHNRKKSTTYPKELTSLELLGILQGPWMYLISKWHVRHDNMKLDKFHYLHAQEG